MRRFFVELGVRVQDVAGSLPDVPEPRLVIEVSDTGIGIEAALLPRVFDAFEQGEPSPWTRRRGGLGLGLAISRSIVEAHGGRLTAESGGPDRGATFAIILGTVPARSPATPGAPPETPHRSQPDGLRILLVEDDEATLGVTARLLRRRGYRVLTARSLASGLEVAGHEEFDLLISDIGLPDGDGHQLIRQLRAQREVEEIAVSGFGMEEDIRRSREAGFVEHLTEPVDFPKKLSQNIRSTCFVS
jgi:CheY-like chemotaxis protein